MSDQPDKQEKVFDPTPQRLKKAREEGNVFQSKEIASVGLLITAVVVFFAGGAFAFGALRDLTARLFLQATDTTLSVQSIPALLTHTGLQVAGVLLPFFGALVAVAVALSVLQTGWNVTFKPLQPKANRISPLQGLKRIFSPKGLFEVVKALIKIAVVGPLAYFAVVRHLPEIVVLHTLPLPTILTTASGWIFELLSQMLGALLLLAGLDFAFEKWKYKEDLKMTKKEIKDEAKESEGDPHLKGKRREMAREMAQRPRMDHAVLKADVVVTNPTHYAIALYYDPAKAAAPQVLVKGMRKRALRIKTLAAEMDVPTVENRPLAHALYDGVPEEEEIPEELYPAVAAVLAEVYRQRGV